MSVWFLSSSFAKGGDHFLLLYARRRIASFTKTLVFGTIAHHAGMHNLCFILAVLMGR
jgi:hypothetical protein